LEIDPVDSKNIWEGCCQLNPSIKYCEVVEERVGLRPSRETVRFVCCSGVCWFEKGIGVLTFTNQ